MTVHVLRLFAELGIPADYGVDPPVPTHLETETLVDVEPNILGKMQRLHPDTARQWLAMKNAAQQDDIRLLLISGFRSFSYQLELIRAKLDAGQQIEDILRVNAAPGFSEHHTGKALDLATPGTPPLTANFDRSDAFAWLQQNAARFNFRMPYVEHNRYGFAYEPWHWSQIEY